MTLLAGSYERFLFGYRAPADLEGGKGEVQPLERAFTHAAHKGVVKCVAAAGRYAATGGADDLIHLYDLKGDKDLSFLMSPGEGAVTAATFFVPQGAYNPTHLLTGSADGSISVWQAGGGWECMKTMRGHRKEVCAISVHPTGLLALSTSRDCCLRMWDLVKGRCTYTVKLEAEAESVAFCPGAGDRYALLAGNRVTLHSVAGEQGVLCTLSHPCRVLCMAWAPSNRVVTGGEDGSLRLWDAQVGVELARIGRAHASRVRALVLLPPPDADSGSEGSDSDGERQQQDGDVPLLVATASSDGSIKLWDLRKAAAAAAEAPGSSGGACLAEANTRARLTCLAAVDPVPVMEQRIAAAAAARQAAARTAQQQQQQQKQKTKQQQAEGGTKKRKGEAAAAQAPRQQQEKASKKQRKEQQPEGKAGKQKSKDKGKSKGKAAAAAEEEEEAAADDGVVVHNGIMEFPDTEDQQQRQKRKQAEVQRRQKQAAAQGKAYRSVPGQPRQPGQPARPRQDTRSPKGRGGKGPGGKRLGGKRPGGKFKQQQRGHKQR